MSNKLIAIPYYSDPGFSPHIRRQAQLLTEHGYSVWGIGLSSPKQKPHPEMSGLDCDVFSLPSACRRGPISFAYFCVRVFLMLWKRKPCILQPIDTPALVPCCLHSILRGIPLRYVALDDLPSSTGATRRPLIRAVWTIVEKVCIKRASSVATIVQIQADAYQKRYGIPKPFVIRNVPEQRALMDRKDLLLRKRSGWAEDERVLIYHGVIEQSRGIELVYPMLTKMPRLRLAVAGYGDAESRLRQLAKEQGLDNRIEWVGPFRHTDLGFWLQDADIGLLLLENVSQCFYHALPCKLFEYVHAAVPVLCSNFPEMKAYVDATGIGLTVDPTSPEQIEQALRRLTEDTAFHRQCRDACLGERERTNWQTESKVYLEFLGINEGEDRHKEQK